MCLWKGVTCGRRHQRVTALNLTAQHLGGSLSPAIGNLSFLRLIDLQSNNLGGEIPDDIGQLSRLRTLILENNSFTGALPPNLTNCHNLNYLAVGRDKLTEKIPNQFGYLSKLEELYIDNNYLTGELPPSIGNLSNLQVISLKVNSLEGRIPQTLAQLRSLIVLRLYQNSFSGIIPPSIYNISSLIIFQLHINQLQGRIPQNLALILPNLASFTVGKNNLLGPISDSFANASTIEHFDLSDNFFSGKASIDFNSLKNLWWLDLGNNSLGLRLADDLAFLNSLTNCTKLKVLGLYMNHFGGTLPYSIANFSITVNALVMGHNEISGTMPSGIVNLVNLDRIGLEYNQLTGVIPQSIGKLTKLHELSLSGNNLAGTIPVSIGNLTGLSKIYLNSNNLQGIVPSSLGKCQNLLDLRITYNRLTGNLPQEILSINTLFVFDLSDNHLAGSFPLQKGNLKNIVGLDISKNEFYSEMTALAVTTNSNYTFSFGQVYKRVLDEEEDRSIVAVKVMNLNYRGTSKSFIEECEALRNIRHRNLVKIISACSSLDFQGNSFRALIYEFMPNGSLHKWLHIIPREIEECREPKGLSFLQRLNITIEVALALDYLHHHCQVLVIHCDVKPSNILLDNDMVAHLGDFGLARFFPKETANASVNQTSSVGLKGTFGYAAPEYAMGSDATISGDVYSFGILILEMFTSKRPTDDIFKDGLNLHNFTKMALPEQVTQIADPLLVCNLSAEEDATINRRNAGHFCTNRYKMQEYLVSILETGVMCSVESPKDRMAVKDASKILCSIEDELIGTEIV